jgi:LPXTG-motif cell wall-anchored protein
MGAPGPVGLPGKDGKAANDFDGDGFPDEVGEAVSIDRPSDKLPDTGSGNVTLLVLAGLGLATAGGVAYKVSKS